MLTYLSNSLSEEEYVLQRTKQNRGTGKLTRAAITNAKLFCRDQFNRELIIVMKDMREEVSTTNRIETPLLFLQKFATWLGEPHLELKMTISATGKAVSCIAKDVDTIKGYVIQIRLYMKKVGGVPITRDDVREYHITYPAPVEKELVEPLTLDEFKIICTAQSNFRRQMLYRIKKDCEARIGAMVQLRKKHFNTEVRPIEVFFPKHIMKKKNGISYSNTKYVITEDENDLLKLLEQYDDEDLVFGSHKDSYRAIHNEERVWSRLVTSIGFSERYSHSNRLKKSLHSIKAMTFTAAEEAVNETYANAYGDHSRYTRNYLRWTYEKKIQKFRKLEPLISIYTKIQKVHDSPELFLENQMLKSKLTEHDNILNQMIKKEMEKTEVKPDEKTQKIMLKLLKKYNLI